MATRRSARSDARSARPVPRRVAKAPTTEQERREAVARYLVAAIAHVDAMSDYLTTALRRRGAIAGRGRAPQIEPGDDVAEVVDVLARADAFADTCAAGIGRFSAVGAVPSAVWEACWRGAAHGWSSLVRGACRRTARTLGLVLPSLEDPAG